MQTKYLIYELEDDRTVWLRKEGPVVLTDGKWVPVKGLNVDQVLDARPLTDDEINALVEAGTLSQ